MANKRGIEAGGAYVRIFADDSPLRRTLKKAADDLKSFSKPLIGASKMIGGAMLTAGAAAVVATKQFANYGDSVGDASQRTGLSTEALSELGYAAKLSGSDMQTLEKGFRTFTKVIASGANNKALEALGLDAKTLAQQSPDRQLEAVLAAFQAISSPTQRAAMAMQLFGKAGADLVPLLSLSGDEVKGLRDEAKKLGVSLNSDQVAAAAAFNDALDKMQAALVGISTQIGAALAPLLTYLADQVLIAASSFGQWLADVLKFVASAETAFATLDVAWAATTEFFGNAFTSAVEKIASELVVMQVSIEGIFDTVSTNIQIVWAKAMAKMVQATFAMVKKISKPLADLLRGAGMDTAADFIQGAATGIGVGGPMVVANQDKEAAKMATDLEQRRKQREVKQAEMLANISSDAAKTREQRTQDTVDAQTRLAAAMAADQERITAEAAKRAERARLEAGAMFSAAGGGMESAGTFSAQAIAGLGAQNLGQDMLNALTKIAGNTDQMAEELAAGGVQ